MALYPFIEGYPMIKDCCDCI